MKRKVYMLGCIKCKKGIFFSLGAFLVLISLITILNTKGDESTSLGEIESDIYGIKSMSKYVNSIEKEIIPKAIKTAAKLGLGNISQSPASFGNIDVALAQIILNGTYGSDTYIHFDKTLYGFIENTTGFMVNEISIQSLTYDIISMSHIDEYEVSIIGRVSYELQVKNESYFNSNLVYVTNVTIFGFNHPIENDVVKSSWITNSSRPCFVRMIKGGYSCGTVPGLCRSSGCN